MSFMLALYTNKSDSKALALTGRFETRVVEAWNIFLMRLNSFSLGKCNMMLVM